jgi:glycosyltransferase involved in cell wall biosynthesis
MATMKKKSKIKKRILLITPFCPPSVGGAETHLEDLYDYLRHNHYFVYVLTYQPITVNIRGESLEKKENLEIHRLNWFGHNLFHKLEKHHPIFNFLYLTPYLMIRSIFFMINHQDKIDIIHAHGLNAAFIAVIIKKLFKKKALMSTMALYCFKKGSLFAIISQKVLSSLDKILTETQESMDEIMAIGVDPIKMVVFSHWVNQYKFKPENKNSMKIKLGWQNKFVVLFVGRAIPIKGGDTLTKVISKINPKINFAIISNAGPLLSLFEKTAKRYKNFIFVGGVDYKDLHNYYKAADIFIIPSRYEEGAARVVMEAVACGLPVICSNKGALPSVLDSSVAVFTNPDEINLRKEIEKLYQNRKKLNKLATSCQNFANTHFGLKNAMVITNAYHQ